ncbi:heterokaryon incompatibility protein-domain-containing protein [Nemania sp. FL0031]|nr:heterokaryon incompatibility protein-domain-containing protein [Nemania sp. FL0031]
MRLIYTRTDGKHNRYEMREFFGDTIPKYAILSHTWGEDEVNFKDMQDRWVKKKEGFRKILYTCEQAQRDGIDWAWIDTCCIDKSSSAELSEAINSMYAWYHSSATCYAYLADVLTDDDLVTEQSRFRGSRWFNRSWTLQELIAPREVKFYDKEWRHIGNEAGPQNGFAKLLEEITGIPKDCLVEHRSPSSYSVAKRMSWASKRKCTRIEDIAYSLIGIFNVNMPLLYGEGAKAFIRLQEEIMKEIDDHSLYAWTLPENDTQSELKRYTEWRG